MEYKKKIEYATRIAQELQGQKSSQEITEELKAEGLYDRDINNIMISARKIVGESYLPKIKEYLLADKDIYGSDEFRQLDKETIDDLVVQETNKLAIAEKKKITKLIKEGQTPEAVFDQVDKRFLPADIAENQILSVQKVKNANRGSSRMLSMAGGVGLILLTGAILVGTGRLFYVLPVIGLMMIIKGFFTEGLEYDE